MAGETIGLGAKFYVYNGSIGAVTPVWIELDIAQDVTGNDTRNEATVKDRRSEFEKVLLGQRVCSFDVTVTHVKADAALIVVRNAYYAKTDIAVAMMTGDITAGGEEGLMFDAKVVSFGMPQPFEDTMTVDISFKPSAESAEEPELVVVAGT